MRRARVLVALLVLVASAAAQVSGVERVGMTVSDMDRSIEFFSKVLTFEKISDVESAGEDLELVSGVFGARVRIVRMKLGDEELELTEYLAPQGRPVPADIRANDRSFQHIAIIVSDMDRAYATLRQHKVKHASTGPQTIPAWNQGAAGIRAFYFRDPDGHFLEILSFPAGKGNPKWQEKSRLFLGIDHTAIVVGDTDRSLDFYRDVLGMHIAGESENYGTEQEHLNNVFGARLRITALRGPSNDGPGIELLEYLTPSDGRPVPVDLKGNDILYWQISLAGELDSSIAHLRRAHTEFVSMGRVGRKAVVRDPDGHALLLEQ